MSWEGKSKGGLLGYKIFVFVIRRLGIRFAYFILWFVSIYFNLKGGKEKQAITNFYTRDLKIPLKEAKKLVRKNYRLLGQTLIDKIAFQLNKKNKFNFDFNGHHHLKKLIEEGKSGALIGAHVGNYEIAGNMLMAKETYQKINVVMFENEHKAIKEFLDEETGGASFDIITIKPNDLSHVIQISAAVRRNEFIGIHGDRYLPGARILKSTFLGKEAIFPAGPFEIASKLKVPTTFVYCIKSKGNTYTFYGTEPIVGNSAQELLDAYTKELESKVREFPEQWFNYYDFFETNNAS